MPGSYRQRFEEIDLSGFVQPNVSTTGFMPLISRKGRGDKPVLCQSEKDVLTNFGNPSSDYPSVFEAIAYCRKAPCWLVSALGTGSLFGGIDVKATTATGFGIGAGRQDPSTFVYTAVNTSGETVLAQQDGKTKIFSAVTLTGTPIVPTTLVIKVGTKTLIASDSGSGTGTIAGSDIDSGGTNTIVYATGVTNFKLNGTAGVSQIQDIVCEADVAGSLNNKYFWIFTVAKSYYVWFNVNSGGVDPNPTIPTNAPASKQGVEVAIATGATNSAVATAVNAAINALTYFDSTVNTATVTVTNVWAEVVMTAKDGNTSWAMWATVSPTTPGTASTGAMPRAGETVTLQYVYTTNQSALISHSFFASSPYADDLRAVIHWIAGTQFKLTLQQVSASTVQTLKEYTYSLVREKDNFGRSLYIFDIFNEDLYVIPVLNASYNITGTPFSGFVDTTVSFSGGTRGAMPSTANITSCYTFLQKPNKYGAEIIMDPFGNDGATINTVINSYQFYSQGITVLPMGLASAGAIKSARSALGLDTDDLALYCNFSKIKDVYNDSFAWISNIGSIGGKYAICSERFGAESPAGVDENGRYGGQLSDWRVVEMEHDFSDGIGGDTQTLDEAQVNPFVFDEAYGLMARGDKTLQVSLSDTSYVGTRRMYKYIIKNVILQVLRKQEFKVNDGGHRLRAKLLVNDIMSPIFAAGYLREYYVVCDKTNNTDVELDQRKFIVDIYVKTAPNAQFTLVRLTRMSQGTTLADILPAA